MDTAKDKEQRILVVEDSPEIQRVIEICLRQPARQFDQRRDGASGLAAARDLHPDVMILDIRLPGIDGWEVLRQLRSTEDGRDVAVLVVTGRGDGETRQRASTEGADGFISKPFRPAELRRAVELLVAD
jgi:DNA-binding response OmpR family regulator